VCAADECVRYRPAHPVTGRISQLVARLRPNAVGTQPPVADDRVQRPERDDDSGDDGSVVSL